MGASNLALREKVLRGGVYLSAREGIGLGVGVLGVLFVTRLIGPTQYGLYRGAMEIVAFFAGVARWGLDAYLVRREEAPSREVYHQVFTLLLLGSAGFMALGFGCLPLLGSWLGDARYLAPLKVLLLSLPFTVLSIPAVARLERDLDYRKVAALETTGQILYHGVAVLLAALGAGLWAPVAGYVTWQLWATLAGCFMAKYRPGWHWSAPLAKEMLAFGTGYSSSFWVYNLRSLVNPLVVGHYLGAQQVGFVSLTIRLIEVLGFVRAATFRLALAALGRLQQDTVRLRRALEEAMGLQALAVGLPLAVFALAAPQIIPRLFGNEWAPALSVFPFIATGFLVAAVFGMHTSILYVCRRNLQVTLAYAVHVALFAGTALLLVPRLGLRGYGLSELVAIGSAILLHQSVARLFPVSYRRVIPWFLAFLPPLFAPLVGWPWTAALALPAGFSLADRLARSQVLEAWSLFRRRLS